MHEDLKNYINGVIAGDRRLLAKTITIIESVSPSHHKLRRDIMHELIPNAGKAVRIGITGVPGVGKSSFIETLGVMLVEKGHHLAVLAIDPSSTISGGSIMADKTRMTRLSVHPNAFIRPSPSSGTLGGVTRMTRETIIACEAAGFDIIIVETVGVGQSETTVSSMVDFFLVLLLSGAGDELQGIKKGVLERADALAINKADGENLLRAEQAKKTYETALHLLTPITPSWSPPVFTCSAIVPSGLEEIWHHIMIHREKMSRSGELFEKRREQNVNWMWSQIEDELHSYFFNKSDIKNELSKITKFVKDGEMSPTTGAEELLSLFYKKVKAEP